MCAVVIVSKFHCSGINCRLLTIMAQWTLFWHPISPACQAVRVTSRFLDLDSQLDLRLVELMNNEQMSADFLGVNPLQQVPVLVGDDGFKVTESRAIMGFLCSLAGERGATIYPSEPRSRAQIDRWMYLDVTCLWHRLKLFHLPVIEGRADSCDVSQLPKLHQVLRLLDAQLITGYICGSSPTLADLGLITSVSQAKALKLDLGAYGYINKWYNGLSNQIEGFQSLVEGNTVYAHLLNKVIDDAKGDM